MKLQEGCHIFKQWMNIMENFEAMGSSIAWSKVGSKYKVVLLK